MNSTSVVLVTSRAQKTRRLITDLAPSEVKLAPDWNAVRAQLQEPAALYLIDADDWSGDALEVLAEIVRAGARAALYTAHPTADLVLSSLARGAVDVLPAPLTAERVRTLLNGRGGEMRIEEPSSERWVGQSPALLNAYRAAADAAATRAHVLLVGERGVGKQLLARVIHETSAASGAPFVGLNCGALESALATELFGQQQPGSDAAPVLGQLERAGAGTVYLDEVERVGAGLQSRLGDALVRGEFTPLGGAQARPLAARIMAGVSVDPRKEPNRLLPDLVRSFGVEIYVPPLRDRPDDVPLLTAWFAAHFARVHNKLIRAIAHDAMRALQQHDWPGNVRELRAVLERAVIAAREDVLQLRDLPDELVGRRQDVEVAELGDVTLAAVERRHIRRILQHTGGRLSEAAQLLGIHRNTLRRKLEEYDITITE